MSPTRAFDAKPEPSNVSTAPASFGQRQLWLYDRLHGPDGTYNIPMSLRLEGPLDAGALARSLNEIVRRHEALRTTFEQQGDDLLQVIAETLTIDLRIVHAVPATGEAALDWVRARTREEGAIAFDLARGPLLRAVLYRLGADDHVLVLTLHHTVFDGWSVGVLLAELDVLYRAAVDGQPPALPELTLQFADYAAWQAERLEAGEYADALAYWRGQLAGANHHIALPTDRPRPRTRARHGRVITHRASPELRAALATVARRENVTLFMLLVAAFAVLIRRYSGQHDVLIATPFAGRTREELEPLIGYFVNTVMLRARLDDDPTVRELLQRTRAVVTEAHDHQDVPFDTVVQAVRAAGSGEPLYPQVMLALQSATPEGGSIGDLRMSIFWVHNDTAKFDWFLNVVLDRDGLRHDLEYDSGLFDEGTATLVLRRFGTLLGSLCGDPDQRVSRLAMLDDQETRALAGSAEQAGGGVWAPIVPSETVARMVDAQVASGPDAVAVTFGTESLTYRELDRRANRLAQHLVASGVGAEVLVGIALERSAEMLVAMLAVVRAGGAYVPLDPAFPADRLAYIVEDSGMSALVTHRDLDAGWPTRPAVVVRLDADAAAIAARPDRAPEPGPSPADLAYVIYTSGSTGRPKGVEIQHAALGNLLTSMRESPGFRREDTLLAITTLSFDIAGLELWLPLVSGGRVVIAGREDTADPRALIRLIERARPTVMQATPAMWRLLLDAGWRGDPGLTLMCGGEALTTELAARLVERGRALWNLYGPTETTIWSTCGQVTDPAQIDLGQPVHQTDVMVLDDQRQPVPAGVPGVLYIGGAGLARGYRGRPELTAERFIPHPFRPDARAYRTGDRVRQRPNGRLEYLGREDYQVKVRGFRVELGEVEAVLRTVPGVREAVVLMREDTPGDQRLVAYVEGVTFDPALLRDHLRRTLPDYAVPSAFVPVDAWPMTPNAKIDRGRLQALAPMGAARSAAEGELTTETERRLGALWCRLLNVTRVGRHDDFFLLGGHSLIAMRLIQQVHDSIGVTLPLGTLFQHSVLSDLAAHVDGFAAARAPAAQEILVRMDEGGGGTPWFWVHGVGGEIFQYMAVSRHLAARRPVYGFAADWTRLPAGETTSLETIAARYIRELKSIRPRGPYHLGGFCNASPLLLEMVRQLEDAGDRIGVVAAIAYDLRPVETSPRGVRRAWHFLANLPQWIRYDALPSGAGDILGRASSRLRTMASRYGLINRQGTAAPDVRHELGMWRFPDYSIPMLEFHRQLITSFEPRPVRARVLLGVPSVGSLFGPWATGPHEAWQKLAPGGLAVRRITGSHFGVLQDPFAAGLADVLNRAIDEAERELAGQPVGSQPASATT